MPRLSLLGAALALVASGSNTHAQEVVKIDTESGRTIIRRRVEGIALKPDGGA